MNSVIILYLVTLSAFTLGYIYNGISLHWKSLDDGGRKRMSFSLKAQENDEIDFDKFRKYTGNSSIVTGLLYLSLIAATLFLVPNLTETLNNREIHIIRTCVIAILFLHLSRELWLETVREKFITRFESGDKAQKNLKLNVAFAILSILLIQGIYTQLTYAW